jgi:LDH2 family malate/lactate/ureidoglycolate dehydrogenase
MEEFQARMREMRETVKGSRPAAGFDEVLIAGDPEWRSEEQRRRDGIPVSRGIWQQLTQLGESLNVAVPVG